MGSIGLQSNLKSFGNFLEQLVYNNKKVIIVGDINLNLLEDSHKIDNYKDIVYMNNCVLQNIKNKLKFTRKTTVLTGTVIDHVISSKQIKCKMSVPISDHKMIHCSFKTPKTSGNNTRMKTHKFTDYEKLNLYLTDRLERLESFSDLMEIIKNGKLLCTSTNQIKIMNDKNWFNQNYSTK